MPTVLFLGACSDISIATARRLANRGYDIQLAGRDLDAMNRIGIDLKIRYGIDCKVYSFDALEFDTHQKFVDALSVFPDITICTFGYLGDQTIAQSNWGEAKRIIDTNLTGAISILNRIGDIYEGNGNGVIIGISSVAGERGRKSNYIYGCAKAGFTAYLSGLRHRLYSSRVRVISIKPGFVRTKMTAHLDLPSKLTATPVQVARAIERAIDKPRDVVYVKLIWKYIMIVIKHLPERIFKRTKL